MRPDPGTFREWLQKQGAEVIAVTNPYELARFIAHGKVHVIYQGRRGVSAFGFAEDCWNAFQNGQGISMGFARKHRTPLTRRKQALFDRDGDQCFFCGMGLTFDEATIEHLVARVRGGPDHLDNLALAHEECNAKAANLPLMKKLVIREGIIYGYERPALRPKVG